MSGCAPIEIIYDCPEFTGSRYYYTGQFMMDTLQQLWQLP